MYTPRELAEFYLQGKNISKLLRDDHGVTHNTSGIIEVAYDLQTGSYISAMSDTKMSAHKQDYSAEIARVILSLCNPVSILEAGVGEATTLSHVLKALNKTTSSYGFDLSWSRVAYAKRWLADAGFESTRLCTGNLLHIPFADNSIDVVYTSHSIEPNGGKEHPILNELFRVTNQYLILLEPAYELADDNAKKRMDLHGYCKNLVGIAEDLRYKVREHKLFTHSANPLNPTAMTIIEKLAGNTARHDDDVLACPKFKSPLKRIEDVLFSPEALVAYPIIGGIPCLKTENGVIASKFEEFFSV